MTDSAVGAINAEIDGVNSDLDELMRDVDATLRRYNITEPVHYTSRRYEACEVVDAILLQANLGPVESHRLGALLEYAIRAGEKPFNGDYKRGFEMDTSKAANYAHRLMYGEWLR